MPEDIFITYPAKVAFKTYQTRWQLGDIYISGNAKPTEDNPEGLGCYLVMTGRGCDDIFNILDSHNRTFGHMFHQCVRWFGTEFHFTRLDIAIDDRNEVPFFTPAQIQKKFEKEEFVSTSDFYHFDDSKYDTDDLARTAYLGSGKSAISYRFYDKDREVSACIRSAGGKSALCRSQQEREQQKPLENVPVLETLLRERRAFEASYPQNTELASGNPAMADGRGRYLGGQRFLFSRRA